MSKIKKDERQRKFFELHDKKLALIREMWADPKVQFYNDSELPSQRKLDMHGSVMWMGPTSRSFIPQFNWRSDAWHLLRVKCHYKGWMFMPEPRGIEEPGDFTERGYIHLWESTRMKASSDPAFWIPRDAHELQGLNTNLELGVMTGRLQEKEERAQPFKLHVGWPDHAQRMGLPNHYLEGVGIKRYETLMGVCASITGRDN